MKVQGHCPMGCGQTLHVLGGEVTCASAECPNAYAVKTILGDPETEHVAVFTETGVTVQHPLRERVEGDLFACDILGRCTHLGEPPEERPGRYPEEGPGRYRVTVHQPDGYSESYRSGDVGLDFERLGD